MQNALNALTACVRAKHGLLFVAAAPRAIPFSVRYPRNHSLHAHNLCSRAVETTLLDIGDPSRPFGLSEPPD